MHVLTLHGHPIARHDRWQYLCMLMAAYSADEQAHMHITSAPQPV